MTQVSAGVYENSTGDPYRDSKGRFVVTTGAGRYARIQRNGQNLELHRYIWEQQHGPIPAGLCVHHINGDKKDNRMENLMLVSPAEHNRLHSPDRPIWNAGLTRETSPKWNAAMEKRMWTKMVHYAVRCNETLDLYHQGMRTVSIALALNICTRQVLTRLHVAGVGVLQ